MNHLSIQCLRRRCSAVIILSLVWSVWLPLYAQVIIKEKVIITPDFAKGRTINTENPPMSPYTDSSFIRVVLSWDNPHCYSARIYAETPYGEQVYYGSSPISHSFTNPRPGLYHISAQACSYPPDTVTFRSQIFLNDSLVVQDSVTTYLYDCCYFCCLCNVYGGDAYYTYNPTYVRFEVEAEKDTLSPGDTTRVNAIALDAQDREVWINPTTLLTYRVQPDTLGRFIDAAGDTVPAPLSNVQYQDARAGRIRFLANRIPPDTLRVATIKVVQMNDTTKRGSDTVWIKNPAYVKITRPNSTNIYPTYPRQNDSTTKRNWLALELRVVLSDSSLVPNYWVRLDTAALVDSGGHSHDGTRPMGKYIVPKVTGQGVDTITSGARKTDSTGVLKFRFLASQFGGKARIRAHLVSDTTKFDTLSLITRVPNLQLLPDGSHYVKIGGTCLHHGPRDDTNYPNCRTPDTDHWGTNTLIQAIQGIADAYDTLHTGIRLRINDMSLLFGGGFDLGGHWDDDIYDQYPTNDSLCNDVGHCEHRQGITADVSHQGLNQSGNYVAINLIDLRKIAKDKTGRNTRQETQHDHVRVNE